MERELILRGFNDTDNTIVEKNALLLAEYWSGEGRNQETSFDELLIKDGQSIIEINLSRWESAVWSDLFDFLLHCELSHIKILETYRNKGFSGKQSLDHMSNENYVIESFPLDLSNIDEADALFEYRESSGEFDEIPDGFVDYLDRNAMLRDWQINNMPVIEIEHNTFAILFR